MLCHPNPAFAQSTSLKVTPSLIRIEAKPPADVWTPFTIENNSDQPVSFTIGYKAFDPQASSKGHVVFLNDGTIIPGLDKKIFEKMQIVDDQNISHDTIALGPQQKMRLRLRILLPNSEPTSDYYFSLIFLETPPALDQNISNYNIESQRSYSTLQTGIGINVLLAIGDKETQQASIETFSAPLFIGKGPVPFNLSLKNSGNHYITPHGKILIKNIFGQTVGKVDVPSTIILVNTDRDLSEESNTKLTLFGDSQSNPQSSLIWPETFILGVYTATLTLTLSNDGPVYIRTINFVGFPVVLLLEILIFIAAIIYIYLRVKRKLS